MSLPLSGFGFLFAYIVLVGTASFLEKYSMKQLNPYQVNFLMTIGMAVTAIPALWIKQGNLKVPTKARPLPATIGLLKTLGANFIWTRAGGTGGRHGHRNFCELRLAGHAAFVDIP